MFRFDAKKEQRENAFAHYPVVEVPDVEAAAFKVMLSFIYTDDLSELSGDNAMAVLYAAKKYNIPDLVLPSLQIPISKLRNVFLAYAQARLFDLEDFANNCLSYIDKNADILLKSEAFLQIDEKLLCEILERDELKIREEISVWQAAFGTLLMDIEKMSEFAREVFLSSQISEKVYINGLPWIILAQIRMKWGSTDNENCLGIYLLCIAPKEDSNWRCRVHSATFRIVSQKKGAHNSTGTLYDNMFNNKKKLELMDPSNGFYNREEDKVTLDIDITVKQENINKFVLNESKSKGTLFMEIEKMSEFAREIILSERKSETVHIKGLSWKILAQINQWTEGTDNAKCLGIFLFCAAPNEENWSCECSAIIRIVSQMNDVLDYRVEFNDKLLNNERNGWGTNFFLFAQLMDPSKGFYNKNEDKVTVAIDFIIKEAKTNK
ncbi:hypothetical protein niasHT_030347 [Heterodera trifolii]|uniref:MATH domain-containing protein n=1 Tax=Heterodera trifolii TaxID=157864 RepID=A0ABD2KRB1_9BILA